MIFEVFEAWKFFLAFLAFSSDLMSLFMSSGTPFIQRPLRVRTLRKHFFLRLFFAFQAPLASSRNNSRFHSDQKLLFQSRLILDGELSRVKVSRNRLPPQIRDGLQSPALKVLELLVPGLVLTGWFRVHGFARLWN